MPTPRACRERAKVLVNGHCQPWPPSRRKQQCNATGSDRNRNGQGQRQHVKKNNNTHRTHRNIESKPMNRSSHILLPNTNGASAQIIWSAQFILGKAQSTCHLFRPATQGGAHRAVPIPAEERQLLRERPGRPKN